MTSQVLQVIASTENGPVTVELSCNHTMVVAEAHRYDFIPCDQCEFEERRKLVQHCTFEQLQAVADDYVATMEGRGFTMGQPERKACLRAAAIQDAWRVAFKRVLG